MNKLRVLAMLALLPALACKEEEPENFGTVPLQMLRGQGQSEDPFIGTTRVDARVEYGECIKNFYLTDGTAYQITGVKGDKLFNQEWKDRLCDRGEFGDVADCEVLGFTQGIDENNPDTGQFFLTVSFQINDDALENQRLRVGPLPTEDVVEACGPAAVSVDINRVLRGFTFDGTNDVEVWSVQSISGSTNLAETNQGGAVQLNVAASN